MKKFFISFLILAVFSCFVFWTGWTQAKVPPDSVGIVVSKTSGISQSPVIPGRFSWHWQFLLPTNARLLVFRIQPQTFSKSFSTSLPSSDFVRDFFGAEKDFGYSFSFEIMLSVPPEGLVELYGENRISDGKSLLEYLDGAASYIAQMAGGYFIKKSQENPAFRPEGTRRDDLMRYVQPYIEYPQIEVSTVALTDYELADAELFSALKESLKKEGLTADGGNFVNDNSDTSIALTGDDDE